MNHEEWKEKIFLIGDTELDAAERREIENHLKSCGDCRESLARWEPFPDVNPALIRLSRRYKLAIISNIDRHLLGRSLQRLAVRFDALITAEDVRAYKPNPEIFRQALTRLACPAQEVIHVAFGPEYDLQPAHALEFRIVFLNRQKLPPPEVPLEAEIADLEELSSLWKE